MWALGFSGPSLRMFPGRGIQPWPHPSQSCQPTVLTHTSTMMTMSLGDEAPCIYLPVRRLS